MNKHFTNDIIYQTWKDRYQKNGETVEDNISRVAKFICNSDKEYEEFYNIMYNKLFMPAGRTMSNAGIGRDLTLNNCFVAPQIKDDLTEIFNSVSLGAKTHQRGGGIGYDFSMLRPKGTKTSNDAVASGAISFMDVFNAQTETILQGNRRGANMGIMNVYSMDIEDFILAKSESSDKLNHFNLSVMIDDDFMNAVNKKEKIFLHFPVYDETGKILKDSTKWSQSKEVDAVEIWDLIIRNAYEYGEPGVFFYDNMNKDNNLYYIENIVASNPCSEYLAGTLYGKNPITNEDINETEYGGACNLGSLLLHNFVINPFEFNATLDYDKLIDTIYVSVRMLDNIIDKNSFPDKIYQNYQEAFRTIGLGVTGLADMLTMLNMSYDSQKAINFVDELFNFIAFYAYSASVKLAKEKGSFPFIDKQAFAKSAFLQKHISRSIGEVDWENLILDINTYGIRNGKILSVAPTGTMSIVWGNNCSSGIEPIFALEYNRTIKIGGQSESHKQDVTMKDYAFELWEKSQPFINHDVFKTALKIDVAHHIDMLSVVAFHTDMSVSKTINVPEHYSFEQTKHIYMSCWQHGIKGCTIFRPNTLRQGILSTQPKKTNSDTEQYTYDTLPRGYIIDLNDDLIGLKRKLQTGCGSLHCIAYFDSTTGQIMETYFAKGSTGGCSNTLTGLSRMISLLCRGGIPIESIADQLNSTGVCPSYSVRASKHKDTSRGACCPMAIGYALLDMQQEINDMLGIEDAQYKSTEIRQVEHNVVKQEVKEVNQDKININDKSICPECGNELSFEGGCKICKQCFFEFCG